MIPVSASSRKRLKRWHHSVTYLNYNVEHTVFVLKEAMKKFLLVLCASLVLFDVYSQAVVGYPMQTSRFNSTQNNTPSGCFTGINDGTSSTSGAPEIEIYSDGTCVGPPEIVTFQTFSTTGNGNATARALRVGDKFEITCYVQFNNYFFNGGSGGISFNENTSYTGVSDLSTNQRAKIEIVKNGSWTVHGENTSSSFSDTYVVNSDVTMGLELTSQTTANLFLSQGSNKDTLYNVSLDNSPTSAFPITSFAIWNYGSGGGNNMFWKEGELSATALVRLAGSTDATIDGVITDGRLVGTIGGIDNTVDKYSNNKVTLSAANTYDGETRIYDGILEATNSNSLGSTNLGSTVFSGASLYLSHATGINYVGEALTLNGFGVQVGGADGGALRNELGNNTWTGAITLNSDSRIKSAAGNMTISGAVNGGSNVLYLGTVSDMEISGVISGAGSTESGTTTSIFKDFSGILTLSAANTYTGDTRITTGDLIVASGGNLGDGTSDVILSTGTSLAINSNTTIASLELASGSTVTVGSGATLTVNGSITNTSGTITIESGATLITNNLIDNAGTITVENTGSLVQTGTAANTGAGTYNIIRTTPSMTDSTRYNYWSSPLSDEAIEDVFPNSNTNDFYTHLTSAGWQSTSGTQTPGAGFTATPDINHGTWPSAFTRTFSGTDLNNNDIPVSGLSGSYVLLGNPYPSAISAASVVDSNSNVGTFYFWEHSTATDTSVVPGNTANDYASFSVGSGGTQNTSSGITPDGNIGSCQGFFVNLTSGNSVTFLNAHRVTDNDQFFSPAQEDRKRCWLNLTNNNNDFNQILFAFTKNATDQYDRLYDGRKLKGNPNVAFYSKLNDEHYAIQGLYPPMVNQPKSIPLGVDAWVTGQYTIALDSLDHWPNNYQLVLTDALEGTETDLLQNDYSFDVAQSEAIENRFYLNVNVTMAQDTTQEDDAPGWSDPTSTSEISDNSEVRIIAAPHNIILQITEGTARIDRVEFHSINGQLIQQKSIQSTSVTLSTTHFVQGIYILKTTLTNGKVTTQKIVINQ